MAAMASIAACASSGVEISERTSMACSGVAGSIGREVVVGIVVVGATVETFTLGEVTAVVATGRIGIEFVVVGNVVETAVLVGCDDEGRDVGDDVGVNEDDGNSTVVVLCSVEVVESGRVVVDVVVVGSGCVVVVLDDVCEGCVVSGKLDGTVVGGSLLVVVVSSHVVTVLLGSGSTVVVDISTVVDSTMVVVDEVVVSGSVDVVVVGSGSVVVVVLVVVVAPWVVGTTGETDVSRSY